MSGKNGLQATPAQNLLAVILMLLAALAGRIWFDNQASNIPGVSLLSSKDGLLLAEIK